MRLNHGRIGMAALAIAIAALTVLPLVLPPPPAAAAPLDQGTMLDLINGERAAHGLRTLQTHWDLEDDASLQTARQVRKGTIFHTSDLTGVMSSGWSSLGENVGVGPNIPLLHDAFMDSPGHRANVLGDWTHIGISTKEATNGQTYITVIFMKASRTQANAQPLTSLPLLTSAPADSTDSIFANDINWLASQGFALGCSTDSYCPNRPLSRGEMATMLANGLDLAPAAKDYFTDDDGSPHEANINAVAAAGITLGCNPPENTWFCEQQTLTRQEMASFFTRALDLPTNVADQFVDDDGSIHQANINALGTSGITLGCNPPANDRFCPTDQLTRGQIAAFLRRALS